MSRLFALIDFRALAGARGQKERTKKNWNRVRTDDNVVAPHQIDVGDGELHRACAQRKVLRERVTYGAI
jgi:hypothetical protein